MRARLPLAATAIVIASLVALSGAALAQNAEAPANALGISENDVRDEPNHPDDENGFPDEHDGEFWSPKDDSLILDAYSEARVGHDIATSYDEDVSNIVNVLMHGQNTEEYDHYILPGRNNFEAWWGYWSDTGGGDSLQEQEAASSNLGFVGPENGAIDDADDCSDAEWDEFVWRGANPCASDAGIPEADTTDGMDSMYGFVQPGTHVMHVNSMILGCSCPEDSFLANGSDKGYQPDWTYQNNDEAGGQEWTQGNGFARYFYDASLMISTQVVTSVNPQEIDRPESGETFDPFQGTGNAIHMYDIDIYSSLNPAVEDAYRTAVWDPPQDYGDDEDEENVASALHPHGPKGFAKHDFHDAWTGLQGDIFENVSDTTAATEPQQGLADDLAFGPYHHEPNTADDEYLVGNEIASHDPATSYGGLGDDYYRPGDDQTYATYENEEHFWMDAQIGINTCPLWIPSGVLPGDEGTNCFNGWAHFTPEVPSTSSPVEGTAEEDENTFGPGVLYLNANAGTWHDTNGDTWIGDPTGESDEPSDDPYSSGTIDDPNQYASDEFRGSINVNYDAKLVPTEDTDGDDEKDWGTTGVYVLGDFHDGNPYSDVAMDVVGDSAEPVLSELRDSAAGDSVSYMAPEDENGQLSRYRTQGEIDMSPMVAPGQSSDTGTAFSGVAVVFPAGNLDAPFKLVVEAELTDSSRQSQAPGNEDAFLEGETVLDVDHYDSIQSTQ